MKKVFIDIKIEIAAWFWVFILDSDGIVKIAVLNLNKLQIFAEFVEKVRILVFILFRNFIMIYFKFTSRCRLEMSPSWIFV